MNGGPRCDLCGFRDGHKDLSLMTCTSCGLRVHKECYGWESYLHSQFECWACQAVGKSFQIEAYDKNGKRKRLTQKVRPTKCELCDVSTGNHAMHPLYEAGCGNKARQITRIDPKTKKPYLAWVHSLCAFGLSLDGYMYGTARDGSINDGETDVTTGDDRSVNSELDRTDEETPEKFGNTVPIHHFCYYLDRPEKDYVSYRQAVEAAQKNRCMFCYSDDTKKDSLRIALVCVAGTEDEHDSFRSKHDSIALNECCPMRMHVGCAKWGTENLYNLQRSFYFPGSSVEDPIYNQFCNLHAADLNGQLSKERQVCLQAQNDEYTGKAPNKPFHNMKAAPKSKRAGINLPPRKRARKRWHDNLDKSEATPVTNMERPTLAKSRKDIAGNHSSTSADGQVIKIFKDLCDRIIGGKVDDLGERKLIIQERKKFWKRTFVQLSSDQFVKTWGSAKTLLRAAIVKDAEKKAKTVDLTESGVAPKRLSLSSGQVSGVTTAPAQRSSSNTTAATSKTWGSSSSDKLDPAGTGGSLSGSASATPAISASAWGSSSSDKTQSVGTWGSSSGSAPAAPANSASTLGSSSSDKPHSAGAWESSSGSATMAPGTSAITWGSSSSGFSSWSASSSAVPAVSDRKSQSADSWGAASSASDHASASGWGSSSKTVQSTSHDTSTSALGTSSSDRAQSTSSWGAAASSSDSAAPTGGWASVTRNTNTNASSWGRSNSGGTQQGGSSAAPSHSAREGSMKAETKMDFAQTKKKFPKAEDKGWEQWSHLFLGPAYSVGEDFKFGEWDSAREVEFWE